MSKLSESKLEALTIRPRCSQDHTCDNDRNVPSTSEDCVDVEKLVYQIDLTTSETSKDVDEALKAGIFTYTS